MLTRLIAALTLITIAACFIFADVIQVALWWITLIGALFLAGAGLITLWVGVERARAEGEKRKREMYLTKQQKYLTLKDGFGMLHLVNLDTDIVENLSTYPGTHHNGTWQEPHPAAAAAWHALVGRVKSESPANLLLSSGEQSQQIDLLSILTQPTQSYAVIGGQQVGKTFQARRIAQHWIQGGLKPIVIGPKWDKGEWDGCALFGGQYNFERVSQGMRITRQLATERHSHNDLSHKEHPIQPIFFDDWTGIRAKLEKEAEDFIIEATTLYASVNIVLYFILHLDTANAWGVGKVGAALHQNFIKLFIEPGYNELGLIDRNRNTGYLLMPGQAKKDRRKVSLFSGSGQTVLLPDLILQPNVNTREAKIIALIQAGATDKEIALEIFEKSYLSGDNFYKVKELREKYA